MNRIKCPAVDAITYHLRSILLQNPPKCKKGSTVLIVPERKSECGFALPSSLVRLTEQQMNQKFAASIRQIAFGRDREGVLLPVAVLAKVPVATA